VNILLNLSMWNLIMVETTDFFVIYNKNKYDVQFPLDDNAGTLGNQREHGIGVHKYLQRLCLKAWRKMKGSCKISVSKKEPK